MPLPAELDSKVRTQFHELIDEAEQLLEIFDANSEDQKRSYEAWCVKVSGFVKWLYGESDEAEKHQAHFEAVKLPAHSLAGFSREAVQTKLSTLSGLKYNFENGFLNRLHDQIVANVSADYMQQAEALLGEGIQGKYSLRLAAMLCGVVLETRLRSYCENLDPPVETVKPNGESKTLGGLIAELDQVKAFDKQTRKLLRAWADIRNAAAHGCDDDFTREQVELMLLGVSGFFTNHL